MLSLGGLLSFMKGTLRSSVSGEMGGKLGEVVRREAMFRIYCIREKNLFSIQIKKPKE